MRRVVLNDPPLHDRAASATETAERLARLTLDALGAATDATGRVDYARLAASEELASAGRVARGLGGVRLAGLRERGPRLAFWINVYNALVLHGIVRLGVRRSVARVWNFFGRIACRVDGLVFSLDDVEHGVLRGNRRRPLLPLRPFGTGDPRLVHAVEPLDPRIHFAINCGARSCPPVGVYRAEAIDAQLDLAARSYVNAEVALERDRVVCPRLLKWYRRDFDGEGGLVAFLVRHLDDAPARWLLARESPPSLAFKSWDWSLARPAAR